MRRLLLLLLLALPLSAATFESHDGTLLHYELVGKGEPVVLLSGGPGFSPEYLRPIAEKLGGQTSVRAVSSARDRQVGHETYMAETLKRHAGGGPS